MPKFRSVAVGLHVDREVLAKIAKEGSRSLVAALWPCRVFDRLLFSSKDSLYRAIRHRYDALASILLEKLIWDTEPAAQTLQIAHDRGTLLRFAVETGDTSTVEALLELGALGAVDNEGKTPWNIAKSNGGVSMLDVLSSHPGSLVTAEEYREASEHAILSDNDSIIEKLVGHNTEIAINEEFGREFFQMAIRKQNAVALKNIMNLDVVNVNERDEKGDTPLNRACHSCEDTLIRILISHPRTDPNIANNKGWTPLWTLINGFHSEQLGVLLDSGKVDVNRPGVAGWAAMHLVARCDWFEARCNGPAATECLAQLLKNGADINLRDMQQRTPLIIAVCTRSQDVAIALVEAGADTTLSDQYGKTAWDYLVGCPSFRSKLLEAIKKRGIKLEPSQFDWNAWPMTMNQIT